METELLKMREQQQEEKRVSQEYLLTIEHQLKEAREALHEQKCLIELNNLKIHELQSSNSDDKWEKKVS